MKGRVIALDTQKDRGYAAALVVDGRLEDLILDPPKGSALANSGDICVVRVKRKLPKSGAFCEMAGGQEGFLKDARSVKEGDRLLAQVVSLPEPGKAVTLTTRILYKGPRLILTPGAPGINVSRRIGNEAERARLVEAVEAAIAESELPAGIPSMVDGMGVIVRSAAKGEDADKLAREFECLNGRMRNRCAMLEADTRVLNGTDGAPPTAALAEWLFPRPAAIYATASLAKSLGSDGAMSFHGDDSFPSLIQPEHDPFEAAGIHDAIEALKSPCVAVDGATMIIEPTRALVAFDVNTGADFSPAAGLKTNLAVARELPRQLRLRGLGGQVVVDFAPMPKQHRRKLDEALKSAFRADPIETALVGWTQLGLYEIQRKRERRPLHEVL